MNMTELFQAGGVKTDSRKISLLVEYDYREILKMWLSSRELDLHKMDSV